jgi:hypothetical protein
MPLLLLLSFACEPKVAEDDTGLTETDADTDTDSDADGDTDTDTDTDVTPTAEWHVLAATTDYTTGALARIDSDGTVHDAIAPVSSDTAVQFDGGLVYVLQRSSENTISVYAPGEYTEPRLEFSTGDGTNPTSVATCGGMIWSTLQLTGELGIFDPSTGFRTGTVDLAAWADADGSAEPDALWVAPNGYLYVTLAQLDYINTYSSVDGSGTLLKVDCATHDVVGEWETGPNPGLVVDASDPTRAFLSGGDYFTDDFSGIDLDGGVWVFDSTSDTLEGPLVTEADLGFNIGGIYATSNGWALTTLNDTATWDVVCVRLSDWSMTVVDLGDIFVSAVTATPDDTVWVSQAPGYDFSDPDPTDDPIGIVEWDPTTCTPGTVSHTALGPSSLTTVVMPVE